MKPADIPDPLSDEARPRDAFLHAAIARATHGISPIAVGLAYLDWFAHLSASPGRQQELMRKALRKLTRFALYSTTGQKEAAPAIEPLSQDRRFEDPAWQRSPFNLFQQSFLLTQQWLWNATTGVRGVGGHHENVVTFVTRQWLDIFSPSNFLLTNPVVLNETRRTYGMNLARGAQNLAEDVLRLAANRPPVGAEMYRVGDNIAVTRGKVIFRNGLMELIQYEPMTPTAFPEPLLIVPSWIMKYYILDLSAGNSLVRYLVGEGHTVFMISWKNPDADDRDLDMSSYLHRGVLAALGAIAKVCPGCRVHGLGYCLGGTLLTIAAAMLARDEEERLATLTLLASELDFTEPGELGLFIDESQIAFLEDLIWSRGYLDGKEMTGAFTLLNSVDLVWSRMVHEYLMGQRASFTDFMAWNADATRMPCRMHVEYLRRFYLHNDLAEGRFEVDGRPVALTDIRAPCFVVGTERDHVSPWKSVYKVHLLMDTEITFILTTGGHNVGIVNPPREAGASSWGYHAALHAADVQYRDPDLWYQQAQRHPGSWWPALAAWLAEHSGERGAPPAMGAIGRGLPPLDDAPGRYVLAP